MPEPISFKPYSSQSVICICLKEFVAVLLDTDNRCTGSFDSSPAGPQALSDSSLLIIRYARIFSFDTPSCAAHAPVVLLALRFQQVASLLLRGPKPSAVAPRELDCRRGSSIYVDVFMYWDAACHASRCRWVQSWWMRQLIAPQMRHSGQVVLLATLAVAGASYWAILKRHMPHRPFLRPQSPSTLAQLRLWSALMAHHQQR